MNNKFIQFEELNNYDGVIHLFTKKPYDFNRKNVSDDYIRSEYEEISKMLNYDFINIKKPNQTHSNNVRVVTSNNLNETFENSDGLITNLKGVALVTSLADCQGILLYDSKEKVIGNIHSGWRGTLNTIILNAIDLMTSNFNCKKENIKVFICPCIHKCCFEVDEDVMLLFKEKFLYMNDIIYEGEFIQNKKKYFIDTVVINKNLLLNQKIKEENIFISDFCTKCNANIFHSYRREVDKSGRNIALICLK